MVKLACLSACEGVKQVSISIIRICDHQSMTVEWTVTTTMGIKIVKQGSLQECADSIEDQSVILLLPASDVLLLEIDLPVKSNHQLKKALPFALEEWLADDVETYHIVYYRQPNDKIEVAIINAEKLKIIIAACNAAGIQLTGIYSEVLGLPYQENTLSVLINDQKVLLRTQQWLGGGIDLDTLPYIIEKWLADYPSSVAVNCWTNNVSPDSLKSLPIDLNVYPIDSEILFLKIGAEKLAGELNLLTGIFKQNKPTDLTWKKWLPALSVFFITLVMQFGFLMKATWEAKAELARIDTETLDLFTHTFPEIKRVVNIKAQADQQLLELKAHNVSKGSPFMDILYQTGGVFSTNTDIEIKKLDFVNKVMRLQFVSKDIAKVDQLKQQIESAGKLTVAILALESKQNNAEVDFEIKQK